MADLSSLVLKLSADVATWQGDLGKASAAANNAADKIVNSFEKGFDRIADGVKELATQLAAAFAVDRLVEAGKAAIELGDQFQKMSQKVGVSVESLSSLRAAAQLSDVSFEDLGGAMEKLARTAASAAGGSKEQAATFQAMGIAVKDANGQLKPMQEILQDVATKFAGYEDGAAKTALAQRAFGKSGADLIPLLNQLGEDGFAKVTQAAKDYGQQISGTQAKQSEEFNDNLTRLGQAASGFALAVVRELLPALVSITGQLDDAAKTTDDYQSSSSLVVTVLKEMLQDMVDLSTVFARIPDEVRGMSAAFSDWTDHVMGTNNELNKMLSLLPQVKAKSGDGLFDFKAGDNGLLPGVQATRDFFSFLSTPTKGSDLSDRMGIATLKPQIEGLNTALGITVADIPQIGQGLTGLLPHITAVSDAAKKIHAPIVPSSTGNDDAAKAADAYASSLVKAAEMLAKFQSSVSPSDKALQDFVKAQIQVSAQADDMVKKGDAAGRSIEAFGAAQAFATQASEANAAVLAKQNAALAKQGDVLGRYLEEIGKSNALAGLTDREKAVATAIQKVTDEYNKNTLAGIKNGQSLDVLTAGTRAAAGAAFDLEQKAGVVDEFVKQFGEVSEFDKFTKGIEDVGEALDKAIGDGAVEKAKKLQQTMIGIKVAMAEGIIAGAKDGLTSLQSMTTEGSKAFNELKVAIDLTTIAEGVLAIIHQLSAGDVYSAIPRALAVAAAIAQLGVDVGSVGGSGGGSQSAEARQATQGTGTVLGDSTAKSDSIAKAVEITANSSQQLVGLNRGMLTALVNLQNALGAAGNQLARGAGNATFSPLQDHSINLAGPGSFDPAGAFLGSFLFGGKEKLIDSGIQIMGGTLNDILQHVVVGAYQTIETSGGLFSSDSTKVNVQDISDSFGKQFQLVIQSIADTVKQGALALGLLPADVEAAMASFQVAQINISLKGLSADDQQKALEAVFSQLFDGLAGAIVPFIGQFQQVGEGLGETLVRVATEVQVVQEGFKQLGFGLDQTDPEKFAQIADGLIKAAGGIDAFISGMQSFVENFASSSTKLDISSEALNSAFEQVGLTVPATRDGMWDLMQSLDATTAAGQAQIATLLRLSDTSSAYYDQLDEFSKTLGLDGKSDFNSQLLSIRDAAKGLMQALQRAGASTETLRHVYDASIDKLNELIDELKASANSLAASLGYALSNNLDDINSQISALQGGADGAATSMGNVADAMTSFTQRATEQINLLLGDLSPLNDQEKLQKALAGQQAGTVTPDQVLTIARRLMGTGSDYAAIFAQVTAIGDRTQSGQGGGGGGGGSRNGSDAGKLAALIAQRDKLEAEQRTSDAKKLAQQIADIVSSTGETIQQALTDVGITDLKPFMKDLGITDEKGFEAFITSLEDTTDSQNESTADLSNDIRNGNSILTAILDTLQGNPHAAAPIIINVEGSPTPGGHSGHALPGRGGGNNVAPPRGFRQPPARTMGVH